MIPIVHLFCSSRYICSLVPWKHQIYLLYIKKNPKYSYLFKTKKQNKKQPASAQSSPVPVYGVQLYSYVPLVVVLLH